MWTRRGKVSNLRRKNEQIDAFRALEQCLIFWKRPIPTATQKFQPRIRSASQCVHLAFHPGGCCHRDNILHELSENIVTQNEV